MKTWAPTFAGATTILAVMAGPLAAAQINTFGKLVISADDGSFSARLTGRLHLDGNFYHSGSGNRTLTSGTFVRRARIGVEGNFHEWEYALSFDNATNQSSLEDARIRRRFGPGKLTIGQFKVFEGMEQMAESNDLPLMERSYLSETTPGFKIGAAYNGVAGKFGYAGTIYNMVEAVETGGEPANDGVGAVARGYVSPVNKKTVAVHFGASYAYVNTDTLGDRASVRPIGRANNYRNGDSFKFTLYDRRNARAEIDRLTFESAAINGPLYVEGAYMAGGARTLKQSEDTFKTWYAQASYALTGEAHKYNFRNGSIERLVPSRAAGAVEINARYQQAQRDKVAGAKLTATEFGVTYYADINVRFMVNYGWADNKLINDKPRLLSTRVQFDF